MAPVIAYVGNINASVRVLQQLALENNGVLQRKPGHNQLIVAGHLIKGYRRVCVPMFPGNGGAAA